MALKIRKINYRRWPVTIDTRDCQDDGTIVEGKARFVVHFKPFTEAEVLALRNEIFGEGTDEALKARRDERPLAEQADLEARFLAGLVCGWEGVTDESGAPIPFSVAALTDAVTGADGFALRAALNAAVVEVRFGIAPAKNVETSPAPGPTPAAVEVATN